MIVEHPNGTLFVAGYGSPDGTPLQTLPRLWKSTDHDESWNAVNVETEAEGAIGNSDVDLAIARDGTVYYATMTFDLKSLEGKQITVGVSQDIGKLSNLFYRQKQRRADV